LFKVVYEPRRSLRGTNTAERQKEGFMNSTAKVIVVNFKQVVELTGEGRIDLRNVFIALDVKLAKNFSDWAKRNLKRFKNGSDYGLLVDKEQQNHSGNSGAGQNRIDYWVTVDTAKMIAMMSATEKGDEVRRYFLECEKLAFRSNQMPPNINSSAMRAIAESMERLENTVKEQSHLMLLSPLDLADEHAKPLSAYMKEFQELRDKAHSLYHDTVVARKAGNMKPTGILTVWIRNNFTFNTLKRGLSGGRGATVTQYNRADILQVVEFIKGGSK
jgi:phage anti-repressor protein